MVSDESYSAVPTHFRCPISLDVMRSPVSLCTGVTYDRSSIQRWLDGGNNTCPATMQVLPNKDLIPNHTLQRLIDIWLDSVLTRPPASPPQPLHSDRATELICQLETQLQSSEKDGFPYTEIAHNLSVLTSFAAESEDRGRFLAAAAGGRILPLLVSLVRKVKDLSLLEKIIVFCNVLMKNSEKVMPLDYGIVNSSEFKSSIVMSLKQGKLEFRIEVAKFLELVSRNLRVGIASSSMAEDDEIYSEFLRLITSCDQKSEAMEACLSFLVRLALPKRNRAKLVRSGGVRVLAAALSAAEMSAAATEKLLKLLEMASGCKEGRNEICGSQICVGVVVNKLLKPAATERAVAVLWRLCCLFGEKRAVAAVVERNGMGKILVVLQSNCSPAVRQMCGDLLRVFRCSSKTSCVSWYNTKTTHIMPY